MQIAPVTPHPQRHQPLVHQGEAAFEIPLAPGHHLAAVAEIPVAQVEEAEIQTALE